MPRAPFLGEWSSDVRIQSGLEDRCSILKTAQEKVGSQGKARKRRKVEMHYRDPSSLEVDEGVRTRTKDHQQRNPTYNLRSR
jgi:hypothetical protein